MADTRQGRSSEEIRRTIELTRADMHETVDALERKFSPGELVDELWDRFRSRPGSSLSSMGSAVGGVVREHPMPTALMGLGLAWLAVERAANGPGYGGDAHDGPGESRPTSSGSTRGSTRSRAGSAISKAGSAASSIGDAAAGAARSAGNIVSTAGEKVSTAARSATSAARSAGSKASDVGSTVGEKASRAGRGVSRGGERTREGARRMRGSVRSAFDDQPLAMGAAALGLGLAGGLALPSSRGEDRMMGDASDTVKDEAGDVASDVAKQAGEAAKQIAESPSDESRE